MQWDLVTGSLTTYLTTELSPSLRMLEDPAHMSFEAIFNVIGFIKSHQSQVGPFSLFPMSSVSSPTSLSGAVQLAVDFDLPEDSEIKPATPATPGPTCPITPVALPTAPTDIMVPKALELTNENPATGDLTTADHVPTPPFLSPTSPVQHDLQHITTATTAALSSTVPLVALNPQVIAPKPASEAYGTPEVPVVESTISAAKRKSDTDAAPIASAKRRKAPSSLNLNPRRSTRKKPVDSEPKGPDDSEITVLPNNITAISRTGKPLKNTKNWTYVSHSNWFKPVACTNQSPVAGPKSIGSRFLQFYF